MTRLRTIALQHFPGASEIIRRERLLHEVHIGRIRKSARGQLFRLGPQPLLLFISARLFRFLSAQVRLSAGYLFSEQRPSRRAQADYQREENDSAGGKSELVPPHQFLQPICRARRTGHNRFVVEKPLEVHRQTVGSLVAAGAILLQALHHYPVEVPPQLRAELHGIRGSSLCHSGALRIRQGGQPGTGARRFDLSNRTANSIQSLFQKVLCVERGVPSQ